MKRSKLSIEDVADWHNLAEAFARAARAAADRRPVEHYRSRLEQELAQLREGLLAGDFPVGRMRAFHIRDPKPREIHAPVFAERVLHHALMAGVGPVLERALVYDSYACRVGKGSHAAVLRCQAHMRRYDYFVQIDIHSYFSYIDHAVLMARLARRFKSKLLLQLVQRIVSAYESEPGKGLPIGALTSQHFANYYLADLDRLLLNHSGVRGMVRYMDDIIWFCDSREEARQQLGLVDAFLETQLLLHRKPDAVLRPSVHGTLFCGHRVLPGVIKLSRRKKQRYQSRRAYWENQFQSGHIDNQELQRNMASIIGMTRLADATGWRQAQLLRRPLAAELEWC